MYFDLHNRFTHDNFPRDYNLRSNQYIFVIFYLLFFIIFWFSCVSCKSPQNVKSYVLSWIHQILRLPVVRWWEIPRYTERMEHSNVDTNIFDNLNLRKVLCRNFRIWKTAICSAVCMILHFGIIWSSQYLVTFKVKF